jgi:hypothetical protein
MTIDANSLLVAAIVGVGAFMLVSQVFRQTLSSSAKGR